MNAFICKIAQIKGARLNNVYNYASLGSLLGLETIMALPLTQRVMQHMKIAFIASSLMSLRAALLSVCCPLLVSQHHGKVFF